MSLVVRRGEATAERVEEKLRDVVLAASILNDLVAYTLHTYRRWDTILGYRSFEKKVENATPVESFTARVLTILPNRIVVDLPARKYSVSSYVTRAHYFEEAIFNKVDATVNVFRFGRRRLFSVVDSNGELLVADEVPPRSLHGWLVLVSLASDQRFGGIPYADDPSSVHALAKTKVFDEYVITKKLHGSKAEVVLDDYAVADIMLRHINISLSTLMPVRERTVNRVTVERTARLTVRGVTVVNPSDGALRLLSKIADPDRVDELRRTVFEAIIGVASFISEKIFTSFGKEE